MDTSIIPFSKLTPDQLSRLAALHTAVMHTLLAELGMPLVLRYYQAAQLETGVIGVCACDPSGEITGWAMGSADPSTLNSRLREPLVWFCGQILRLALTRPGTFIELLRTLIKPSDANNIQRGQIELTYIGVSPEAQGKGFGKSLLQTFTTAARSAGFDSVVLSVETDNPSAVRLYQRFGFQVIRNFKEGRFERYRMELSLR